MKNQYREEDCLKRGAWTVFRFKGVLARKRGVVRGVDTLMHTMYISVICKRQQVSIKQQGIIIYCIQEAASTAADDDYFICMIYVLCICILFIYLLYMDILISIYLSVYLLIYLSMYLSIYLSI